MSSRPFLGRQVNFPVFGRVQHHAPLALSWIRTRSKGLQKTEFECRHLPQVARTPLARTTSPQTRSSSSMKAVYCAGVRSGASAVSEV